MRARFLGNQCQLQTGGAACQRGYPMLTDEEIKAFLKDTEADNVERTVSTNKTDKFCEAICAFANDMPGQGKPGYLFIGADDKTGEITGAKITDQLLQNLAYVNLFGRGIATVRSVLKKNNNPPAEFTINEPNYFLAKVREATS